MSTALTSSPTEIQTINLKDWGTDLAGRTLGEEVRGAVNPGVAEVRFDCAGIESMSPSFADEVFGKLSASNPRPGRIQVVNAAPEIIAGVRFAVQQRSAA